ncbi:flagellar basal body-associated FliL family protein [Oceaniglobus ichthyenteri]|uniref:flagellar basal body-associated FliL family protein n=1 Tax=Oceaniglobus ichthyenteri TaxID=2136177 RepID=UPI000D392C39|nr:flagellar basal body-associated FliL family protein [Oceaniglobus ichthyenteri]
MANAEADMPTAEAPRKSGLKGLIIGVVLAALLGGGGFYAVWSGLILGQNDNEETYAAPVVPGLPDIGFVPITPILVSLGPGTNAKHLRFHAQLEVEKAYLKDVEMLLPRVVDVLNSYLRAIEPAELEEPGALTMIRSQMLRRAQIVTGEGRVRDLLIMEFVLN